MSFAPRRRKNYIIWKNDRAYYRRVIPVAYRHLFGGKTAWVIALQGHGTAALEAEAAAYAHQHNQQLSFADVSPEEVERHAADAVAMKVDLRPQNAPPNAPLANPMLFARDGRVQEVTKFAITDDATARRQAEGQGYFVMGQREAAAQFEFDKQLGAYEAATTPDQREIAELKGERAARHIENAAKERADSVLSILPRWKAFRKQAPMTWQKHEQYVKEFAALHGDLSLADVNKSHVVKYVEHVATLAHKGEPLSPTSIQKRLDSIRALLAFAVSRGEIESNPSTGVKPPQDTRPKTSRSWKSFTPDEVKKLVEESTKLWTNRSGRATAGRAGDLMTALQCLIWTGARPEEICQLRREDIDVTARAIRITNDESEDDARARKTKNAHSVRTVPIHPRLQATLEAHLRSHNSALAFPTFEPQARPKERAEAERTGKPVEMAGRYMNPISREWTDHLRAKVTKGDPRKVLYSLRHSWAAESRRAGMPEHVRNALMGHADDNPHAGRYGGDAEWLDEKRKYLDVMTCV